MTYSERTGCWGCVGSAGWCVYSTWTLLSIKILSGTPLFPVGGWSSCRQLPDRVCFWYGYFAGWDFSENTYFVWVFSCTLKPGCEAREPMCCSYSCWGGWFPNHNDSLSFRIVRKEMSRGQGARTQEGYVPCAGHSAGCFSCVCAVFPVSLWGRFHPIPSCPRSGSKETDTGLEAA